MIVSQQPSIWPFVARALGFEIVSLVTEDVPFQSLVGSLHKQALGPFDSSKVQIVFGDWISISHLPASHWEEIHVPHAFSVGMVDEVEASIGWRFEVETYSHAELGGLTAGHFRLGLLLPIDRWSGKSVGLSSKAPRLAPSRVWNILDSTVFATPYEVVDGLTSLGESLPWSSTPRYFSRFLDPRGLAPASGLTSVKVLVPCVFSASRWGVRRFTVTECASLFDVPILVQEAAKWMGQVGEALLKNFADGHPGKVLHLGTDHLMSICCRGGWNSTVSDNSASVDTKEQKAHRELLARIKRAGLIAAQQRRDELSLGVKEDGQKADEAAVPTVLWDEMWMLSRIDQGLEPMGSWWGNPFGTSKQSSLPRWRWGLEVFRNSWLLFRWRRSVTRSLCKFLRVNRLGSKKIVNWLEGEEKEDEEGENLVSGRYVWSDEGRQAYKKGWSVMRLTKEREKRVEAGKEALRRALDATWWDWSGGSSLFFWNWPESHRAWARDGQPHFVISALPECKDPQRRAPTEEAQVLMNKKVNKVRKRCYICAGFVKCLTNMFSVQKGLDDIRMIYDGTKSGLNACLFAPHFSLPVMAHTLRSLQEGYFSADLDVGEMFLNWWMGEDLRAYAGVDIKHVRPVNVEDREDWDKDRTKPWERWVRNFMGMRDSPYRSLQMMIMAKFVAYGDRRDKSNPFNWKFIVLNLPGDPDYDPSLPWVMKVREDGHLACEVYIYVDDGKFTGWSKLACWRAAQRFSKVLSKLGIQDAYRKRTGPNTRPGPWAGTVTLTEGGVFATVTDLKWAKTQGLIRELVQMMEEDEEALPHKSLLRIRGFLIYVGRTYRWMNPYLKGLHLVIDGWRKDRDADGYKKKSVIHEEIALKEAEEAFEKGEGGDLEGFEDPEEEEVAPETVSAKRVPRFAGDVEALRDLTEGPVPATQKCRVKGTVTALYVAGDASGRGFGSAIWDDEKLVYSAGSWAKECSEESSNWREAENLTVKIAELAAEGKLTDKEVWIITDNSTYESTFYKGYSSSPKLTRIIFRLRKIERDTGCILHVIHIAGTRMKEAGIDELSRQDFVEGMMGGASPWSYLPLNEDADQRSQGRVLNWVKKWWYDAEGESWCAPWRNGGKGKDDGKRWESELLVNLESEDWFRLHEIKGHRLWIPPPAAMETVMELFAEDHLVNPHLAHVFVVPRLMTHLWRRHLFKDADVHFYVQAGAPFWPRSMHEPLTVALIFPLSYVSRYRGPWIVRDRPDTDEFVGLLDAEFRRPKANGREEFLDLEWPMPDLQEDNHKWTWNLLRKLLHQQREFPPVQSGISRGVLPGLRGQPLPSSKNVGRRRRRGRKGI